MKVEGDCGIVVISRVPMPGQVKLSTPHLVPAILQEGQLT